MPDTHPMLQKIESRASLTKAALVAYCAVMGCSLVVQGASIVVPSNMMVMMGGALGILTILVFLGCAISWSMWKYKLYESLHAVYGLETERSAGWAVGSYFIPFVNIYLPYQIMKEIWDTQTMQGAELGGNPVGYWWGMWLVSNFATQAVVRWSEGGFQDLPIAYLFTDVLNILSAVFAILLVKRITARHMQLRHEHFGVADTFR